MNFEFFITQTGYDAKIRPGGKLIFNKAFSEYLKEQNIEEVAIARDIDSTETDRFYLVFGDRMPEDITRRNKILGGNTTNPKYIRAAEFYRWNNFKGDVVFNISKVEDNLFVMIFKDDDEG